jgi:hypothetical protein
MSLLKPALTAAAAGGALLASDDADAGLIHREAADAARRFVGRTKGDPKAPNLTTQGKSQLPALKKRLAGLRSVEDQSHAIMQFLHRGSDYGGKGVKDSFTSRAERADGGINGPVYLNGLDVVYEEMVDLLGKDYEPAVRQYVMRRMGDDFKGRDPLSYGGQAGRHMMNKRNLGGQGVTDKDAYDANARRLGGVSKHGRKKATGPVGFSVGAPTLGQDHLEATMHNRDQKIAEHMDNLGLTKDSMYDYGSLLPIKSNIVTGERSLAAPDILRDVMRGLLGLGMTPETGVYDPRDLLDVAI